MADLISSVDYGRIVGRFTAVVEDSGDIGVVPDAIPLNGSITFKPTRSHISYIDENGETASLYVAPVNASIDDGQLIASDGGVGVSLLASNSRNVSASVLWNAYIDVNPIQVGQAKPEIYEFLIEVRADETLALIDVIKANSRVHNVALFNDSLEQAAAEFRARVDAGEFIGPPGPPGESGPPGAGDQGPVGDDGEDGRDGEPGFGGNLLHDGDLESTTFIVSGDYYYDMEYSFSGVRSALFRSITSRKIEVTPERYYYGSFQLYSQTPDPVNLTVRFFNRVGNITRTQGFDPIPGVGIWKLFDFEIETTYGEQFVELVLGTNGTTMHVDYFMLADATAVVGLKDQLEESKRVIDESMALLEKELADAEIKREELNTALNDLALVLETGDVDLTELNEELDRLNTDLDTLRSELAAEKTARENADAEAANTLSQLDINLTNAVAELEAASGRMDEAVARIEALNGELDQAQIDLETAKTDLTNLQTELDQAKTDITDNATNITNETNARLQYQQQADLELGELDGRLLNAEDSLTAAATNIGQLEQDLITESTAREQLAQEVAEDFTERDNRLSDAETKLNTAFPTGVFDVSSELANTVRSSTVEYAVSSSDTTPPTTGWSSTVPTRTPGTYTWFRTVITYGDNSTNTSSAALITGNTGAEGPAGPAGEDGADGTGVTILGSFDTEAELPATGSPGDAYLVGGYLYVWTSNAWENVGLIQGPQGVPGPPGDDGTPTYTWIKYATSATGAGMSDDPTGKTYIGLAYNKPTATESSTATDYQWALFQGPKGDSGPAGSKGDPGAQGVGITSITPYFRDVVRGSAAPAKPTTATPTGWSTTEPAWLPNRDLYRVEKIVYTTGSYAYTTVTKIAAYAGIDAAMAAANGKNLNTYSDLASTSKPGPAPAPDTSRTVGDIHRNRDETTGEIWAEYQWNGTSWVSVNFGDSILRSLDVGKITGGTGSFQQFFSDNLIANTATIEELWTEQLVSRTISTTSFTVASGNAYRYANLSEAVGFGDTWSASGAMSGSGGTVTVGPDTTQRGKYDTVYMPSSVPRTRLVPGRSYTFGAWVNTDGSAPINSLRIYVRFYDETLTQIGSSGFVGNSTATSANTWTKIESNALIPPGAVYIAMGFFSQGEFTGTAIWSDPYIYLQNSTVQIENGAISADKINVQSVAAAVGSFVEVNVGNLVADSTITKTAVIEKLWADGIAAKTVTAQQVIVAPGNIVPDPSGMNADSRTKLGGASWTWNDTGKYWTRPAVTGSTTQFNAFISEASVSVYETATIVPGAQYRISVDVWTDAVESSTGVRGAIYYRTIDGTSRFVGENTDGGDSSTSTPIPAGTWTRVERTWVAPTDARSGAFAIQLLSTASNATEVRIRNPYVGLKAGSVSIENGAIGADKITAGAISATHITSGAITTEKLAALAVNADKIAANAITSDKITALAITTEKIAANAVNADKINAQSIAAATAQFIEADVAKLTVTGTATIRSAVIDKIWADGIAAKSVTTSRLIVASGSIIPNGLGELRDSTYWPTFTYVNTAPAETGAVGGFRSASRTFEDVLRDTPISVTAGQQYSADIWIDSSVSGSDTAIAVYFLDSSGNYISNSYPIWPRGMAAGLTYNQGDFTAPTGATHAYFRFVPAHVNGAAATKTFYSFRVRPKVGAVLIENGAVSAEKLAAGSVIAEKIAALAITTDKIAANAVNADKIVSNSITTAHIVARAVSADKIAVNTILADNIAANAITSEKIVSENVLARHIIAGAITTEKLDARAVTAAKIAAGTITANEINAQSIAAATAQFITVDVTKLTASSATINSAVIDRIWSDGISTKTLETAKLTVTTGNVYRDPFLTKQAGWGSRWQASGGKTGGGSIVVEAGSTQRGGYDLASSVAGEKRTKLDAGKTYAVGAWIRPGSAYSGTGASIYVRLYGSETTTSGYTTLLAARPNGLPLAWTWVEGTITVPDGLEYVAVGVFVESSHTGSIRFSDISIRPGVNSVIIEDGAITADKIAADAITANKIAAGAITADKITGGSFEGKTFTGGSFNGSAFRGGSYATSSAPASDGGVMIDLANGIRGWAPGKLTFRLNSSTGEVSIKERLLATNDSGRGVMLYPTTTTGGGGLWFSHTGDGGGENAAIWRSSYDPLGVEPLNMRGANGGHIAIYGGLEVNSGGIVANGRITGNAGIRAWQDLYLDNAPPADFSANVGIASSPAGRFYKVTSSRRYKKDIQDFAPDKSQVLGLRPRTWLSKNPLSPEDADRRAVGFISEEVEELGLTELVSYITDDQGAKIPDGLQYDRFAAAHQIVLKDHEQRIIQLESENNELRNRLSDLEAKVDQLLGNMS